MPKHDTSPSLPAAAIWVIGPGLAFLADLEVSYLMVNPLCPGGSPVVLHAIAAATLVLSIISGVFARRAWSSTPPDAEHIVDPLVRRRRFFGMVGTAVSALFAIGALFLWLPIFFHNPCQR
jgi:hypothetical protein